MTSIDKDDENKDDKEVVGIKMILLYVIQALINDTVEIVKYRWTDEDEYKFEDLRLHISNLPFGSKCRLFNNEIWYFFVKEFRYELLRELKKIDTMPHTLNAIKKSGITDPEVLAYFDAQLKDKKFMKEHDKLVANVFANLTLRHIWSTLCMDPEPIKIYRNLPLADCDCSVTVKYFDQYSGRLKYEDKEEERKVMNDFISCLNDCRCIDHLIKDSSKQDENKTD